MFDIRIDSRASAGAPRQPKGSSSGGQFMSGIGEFLRRNQELADDVQAQVVANIRATIAARGRAAASTNRLVKVTASPQNQKATIGRVQVGIPSFLERSEAKYWRTIEEGSAETWARPFVGTPLFFVGGKSFPSAHGARPGVRTFTEEAMEAGRLPMAVVKKEIEPMNAYGRASANVGGRAHSIVRAYLEEIRALPVLEVRK